MSYLKLPKTCSDHAVGFQSVNQAIDNSAALLTAFDSVHSIGVGGYSPQGFPTRAVGRHDDILIARTAADFGVDTTLVTPTLVPYVSGPLLGGLNYVRIGAGKWRIYISTAQLYGVVALMKSTASSDYKANCYLTSDPAMGPSVIVTTWDVSSATAADLPFSLVIWAQAS